MRTKIYNSFLRNSSYSRVLKQILNNPGESKSQVVRDADLASGTHKAFDELERWGYVTIARSVDNDTKKRVIITTKGKEIIETILKIEELLK